MTMNLPNLPQPNFSNFKNSNVTKVLIVLVLDKPMSILKCFKSAPVIQDEELPEPSTCLSNAMPPKAIEIANAEVVKVKLHKLLYS